MALFLGATAMIVTAPGRAGKAASPTRTEATNEAPAEASGAIHTTYLDVVFNDGCTISDGAEGLTFDPDGPAYLPSIRVLHADRAFDRFSLVFSDGSQDYAIANPGGASTDTLHGTLETADSDGEATVTCRLDVGPLVFTQTARVRQDSTALRMDIELANQGDQPLTDIVYWRAANPDPDLDNYGRPETANSVYASTFGLAAISAGPTTNTSMGAGIPDAVSSAGFCYRCADASTEPFDPEGRVADWDFELTVSLPPIAPGYALSFTVVYLLGTTPEEVEAGWEAVRDWDRDGWMSLDGDCDDSDPTIHPSATESCDLVDENCNGVVDDGTECFDDDGDGYTEQAGDCDDTRWTVHPNAPEGADTDGDGRPEGDGVDNDCDGAIDEGTDDFDNDGDGYSRQQGDCNDTDPTINPGADETPYDGIDQDCDGTDWTDVDGDGDPADIAGGGDCNDADPTIASTLDERLNGIDDDCDGLIDEVFVAPGDIRLNEFLPDPDAVPDRDGEYIELYNASSNAVYLDGWVMTSALGQRHVFSPDNGPTRLPPGGLLTLAPNPDPTTNGGVVVDYALSGFSLANSGDTLALYQQETTIDSVAYGGDTARTVYPGAALQRDPACAPAPGDEATGCWCTAPAQWAEDSDRGSPGAPNPPCATDADGDGWGTVEEGGMDCDDSDPGTYPGAEEVPDGKDNDCDGTSDEDSVGPSPTPTPGIPSPTPSADMDGDGYTTAEGDCDDDFPDIHPGAVDLCGDGVDQDCSGAADEGCTESGCGGCAITPGRPAHDRNAGGLDPLAWMAALTVWRIRRNRARARS